MEHHQAPEIDDSKVIAEITFRVRRFDGTDPGAPSRFQDYKVPVMQGMTVLEGLIHLKAEVDPTLSWRASCRMGVCGSCGMFINGFPTLACQQQIMKLHAKVVVLEPLPNYPVVKDLVTDFSRLFEAHRRVKPYIVRKGTPPEKIEGEFGQTPDELVAYLQFSYCLKCGLCMSACPTVGSLPEFPGPQPLGQALRYVYDTRDEGFHERAEVVDTPFGIFRCHFAGACSEACPKGIDPAFAIQLLKKEIIRQSVLRGCPRKTAPVLSLERDDAVRKENIPPAPARTVE
ncbi:MAG: succinate dehydrogenase iron-sulfur subunit [Acidobacteria bacterium]|nr:succinate dehydrogenase iron-sulfur subunit [Acidobacteriota bacterium]